MVYRQCCCLDSSLVKTITCRISTLRLSGFELPFPFLEIFRMRFQATNIPRIQKRLKCRAAFLFLEVMNSRGFVGMNAQSG
jgi:hypothetical protein